MTKKAPIHHMIRKQAEKVGITLGHDEDGRVTAVDSQNNPNKEWTHTDAKKLLEIVLNARTEGGAAPADKPAKAAKASTKAKAAAKTKKAPKAKGDEDAEDAEDAEEGEEGEEAEGDGEGRSVVKRKYKQAYKPHDDTSGDDFSQAFIAAAESDGRLDMDALAGIAKANGLDLGRWSHLNPGMQRMNLGNVLRGMQRKGTTVVIGKLKFEGLPQPEKPAKTPKAAKPAKAPKAEKKSTAKKSTAKKSTAKKPAAKAAKVSRGVVANP
jgi:hypothetical protein